MYLVREVFNAKPGKAKDLVKMFKAMTAYFEKSGEMKNAKVMTDATGNYWTVVFEAEVSDIGHFFTQLRNPSPPPPPEVMESMKGYMDCVEGGHREIYVLE
jgi:hypothetical protein